MDAQRFEEAITLALDAFAIGHQGNFNQAIDIAQAAIPEYRRSHWLLSCTLTVFHSPGVPTMLHSIHDNLPLLPADAM